MSESVTQLYSVPSCLYSPMYSRICILRGLEIPWLHCEAPNEQSLWGGTCVLCHRTTWDGSCKGRVHRESGAALYVQLKAEANLKNSTLQSSHVSVATSVQSLLGWILFKLLTSTECLSSKLRGGDSIDFVTSVDYFITLVCTAASLGISLTICEPCLSLHENTVEILLSESLT